MTPPPLPMKGRNVGVYGLLDGNRGVFLGGIWAPGGRRIGRMRGLAWFGRSRSGCGFRWNCARSTATGGLERAGRVNL